MSIPPPQRWLARALRALAAGVLIATLLGSLDRVSYNLASDVGEVLGDRLRAALGPEASERVPWLDAIGSPRIRTFSAPEVGAGRVYQKTTTVNAGPDGVSVLYDLYLDKGDPLYARLQQSATRPPASWSDEDNMFVFMTFGYVQVGGRGASYEESELEVEEVTSIAHFRLRSRTLRYEESAPGAGGPSYPVMVFGELRQNVDVSEVIVNTEGVRVVSRGVVPRSQARNRTHFADLQRSERPLLEFDLVPLARTGAGDAKSISYTLSRFNTGHYRMLQPLLLGLFYALPFFLFFRLRRHAELAADAEVAGFFSATLLVLILYCGVSLLRWLTAAAYDPRVYGLREKFSALHILGDPGAGAGVLLAFFIVALWPRMVRRWERSRSRAGAGGARFGQPPPPVFGITPSLADDPVSFLRAPRPRTAWLLGAASLVLWVLFWACLAQEDGFTFYDGLDSLSDSGAASALLEDGAPGLCLAALYAACAWLLYELTGRPLAALTGAAAALALLALLALDDIGYALWLRPPFAAVLLVPFAYSFARVAWAALGGETFADAWRRRPLPLRAAAVVAAAALAFLLVWPERGSFRGVLMSSLVFSAAWMLGRLWVFGLLLVLLRALRNLSARAAGAELSPAARAAGEVFALTFFFLPAQRWLYVSVAFLLGYALLRKWIFVASTRPPQEVAESREQVRRLVREAVSLQDAERGLRLTRKEMLAKLGKGEVEYEEYTKRVDSLYDVAEGKRRAMLEGQTAGASALRFGPAESAWERGRIFAWHGFLFALPWTLLFVHNVTEGVPPRDYVETVALVTSVVLALAQWPLYGLFLGYFYPHVRGSNGMLKGLFFCAFIFVPMLGANLLANPTDATAWKTFFLWALQLFIQCMLLGFVTGDYETLRRVGLGRRHLIDVHNLGALAAWGSTVVLAIGAAVTTLLTTGAASLISSGLQVILPAVLSTPPPTPTPTPH